MSSPASINRYLPIAFALFVAAGCRTPIKSKERPMTKVDETHLVLLATKPRVGAYIRVTGPGFARTGYIVWSRGISLSAIETSVGYNREYPLPIFVSIVRDGKTIYQRAAIQYHAGERNGGLLNAGPLRDKSDAPELKPGDIILADRVLD